MRAARNPTVRRAAVQAAKKAGNVFSRAAQRGKQVCRSAILKLRGRSLNVSPQQLQKKFKHAQDFGVTGNYSPANAAKLQNAIQQHVASSSTKVIKGTYHGNPVTHYVNPSTGVNVMKDSAGNFVSGWKLSPAQLKHVLSNGKLGGG
jgi:hypothetical protein